MLNELATGGIPQGGSFEHVSYDIWALTHHKRYICIIRVPICVLFALCPMRKHGLTSKCGQWSSRWPWIYVHYNVIDKKFRQMCAFLRRLLRPPISHSLPLDRKTCHRLNRIKICRKHAYVCPICVQSENLKILLPDHHTGPDSNLAASVCRELWNWSWNLYLDHVHSARALTWELWL